MYAAGSITLNRTRLTGNAVVQNTSAAGSLASGGGIHHASGSLAATSLVARANSVTGVRGSAYGGALALLGCGLYLR